MITRTSNFESWLSFVTQQAQCPGWMVNDLVGACRLARQLPKSVLPQRCSVSHDLGTWELNLVHEATENENSGAEEVL